MSVLIRRYLALLSELLWARRAAGEKLTQSEESRFVEHLDEVWDSLSAAERKFVEAVEPKHDDTHYFWVIRTFQENRRLPTRPTGPEGDHESFRFRRQ